MNWDRVEGNWKQIKGRAQQHWGKLANDDLNPVEGNAASSSAASRSGTAFSATKPSGKSTAGCEA